ncbi:MAG: ABC transporter permease [Clostridiales bacterium]|nr:ABC transporter permease [Clostridiales bacterium]
MKVLNDLSIQDLKLNKKRSIVIIIGIILSTALICGVAGLVTSFQKTMVDTAKEGQGNYHTIFYNVPKDELKYIEENKEVKDYFLSEELGYSYLPNPKNVEETPIVNVISMNDKFIENMSVNLKEGKLPENDTELAISTRINEKFNTNYKVGDTITLNINETEQNMENGIPKTYKIVGIIERPILAIESYDVDWFTAITKMQNVNKKANIAVLYNKPKDYIKNTENINNMTKTENNEDGVSFSGLSNKYKSYKYNLMVNKELLAYEGASLDDETLKTIYGLGAFIIGIVLVSSVFVIRNGFEISITERLKQYGMLSSIGATKKQIKKSVYFEGFILGLIGIPLGIISGVFAIYILVNVVNYILKDYISEGTLLTYSMSWIAIAISAFVSIITIWLSCKKSAKKASKVSPIEAIRNSEDVKLKAKKVKCPKIITKIFKTGGEIAYKNLKRSKKKYRTTVISIIVSIVIFISISSFIQYGFKMSEAYYTEMNYNYMVFMQENEDNKEELKKYKILEDISKLPDVGEYSINKSNVLTMNMDEKHKAELTEYGKEIKERFYNEENGVRIDEINVISLSKEAYERYVSKLGGDYEKYKNGAILIDKNINTNNDGKKIQGNIYTWKKGDIITGKINGTQYNIEILAKTEEIPAGVNILYNPDAFIIVSEDFINKVGYKTIALYSNSKDAYKLDEEVKQYKQENNITDNTIQTFNMEESARAENAIVLVISIFLYGFIGVITLIGITNIFNTITTNMNLRKKEFAMLKSIGMTKKEFNRMIRLESIFYGLKSLIIGIPIGTILSYGMYTIFRNNMEMEYVLPYKSIVISIVFVAVIIGIIMKYSMSKINKQNVIETIRNDNI